jgi:hypothetical protein
VKKQALFTLTFIALTALLYGQSAKDFVIEETVLKKYRGTTAGAVIPEGITVIKGFAFSRCKSLTGVIIPASITVIESYAFHYLPRNSMTI